MSGDKDKHQKIDPALEAVKLRDAFDALQTTHKLLPGTIVRQKRDARLYRGFGDNDHCIVVEVLGEPIISGLDKQGTPHFREVADIIVGSLESNSDGGSNFCCYHVDSRRFEPVPERDLRKGIQPKPTVSYNGPLQ